MIVYVNAVCWCGPYIDPGKLSGLPGQFGPGAINKVLRDCVQSVMDAALEQKQVFAMLRQGNGKVIITGNNNLSSLIMFHALKSFNLSVILKNKYLITFSGF